MCHCQAVTLDLNTTVAEWRINERKNSVRLLIIAYKCFIASVVLERNLRPAAAKAVLELVAQ